MYCDGPRLDIECPIYLICGGQDGHENGCPNSYAPPMNPFYDSSVICDVDRSVEVENVEQEAHIMNLFEKLVEQKEECQSFNYTLFLGVDAEKEYKRENVINKVALELMHIGPHSNIFLHYAWMTT
ncbi:hypothetical protein KY290_036876 [Solanum tuberosum]|uniref:Chitin-binding type-2 domain-containing protein n=1 Tax=Solanum tuberosum TaxID=4113 RepID=A0ABQ7TUE6_SOLTU|nr:hypothetical protein KY289_036349 [Solanum tuberosum]KAH0639613.1 hypothetical protein KY285_036199 [Solanum tuberosum]KAH0738171.1 hypothetical protein KY290_036876 [Solanum tuberosum]